MRTALKCAESWAFCPHYWCSGLVLVQVYILWLYAWRQVWLQLFLIIIIFNFTAQINPSLEIDHMHLFYRTVHNPFSFLVSQHINPSIARDRSRLPGVARPSTAGSPKVRKSPLNVIKILKL